jgi:hypothetical protein
MGTVENQAVLIWEYMGQVGPEGLGDFRGQKKRRL